MPLQEVGIMTDFAPVDVCRRIWGYICRRMVTGRDILVYSLFLGVKTFCKPWNWVWNAIYRCVSLISLGRVHPNCLPRLCLTSHLPKGQFRPFPSWHLYLAVLINFPTLEHAMNKPAYSIFKFLKQRGGFTYKGVRRCQRFFRMSYRYTDLRGECFIVCVPLFTTTSVWNFLWPIDAIHE